MSWWFFALALRRPDVLDDATLCREARDVLAKFPDMEFARRSIADATARAEENIGPRAMRAELARLEAQATHGDRELARLEASVNMTERLLTDPIGCIAAWSMTTLAQAVDTYENGPARAVEPSIEDIGRERIKLADAIKAMSWEGL